MNHITNNRTVKIILATVCIIASFSIDTHAFPTKEKEKIDGFTLKETADFATFDAKVFVYEHNRTGAKVEFIQNDDPDKAFMLKFDTRVDNNKGTAHVFEHSATNGSEKYPSRSLTMALFNRGYVTYGNALTEDCCTLYPISSLSEKELLKLSDYYTDLCFNPLMLENEDIFSTEAWRYTLHSPEEDIGIAGTIYSEMNGKYTAGREAITKAFELLYPGGPSSYDIGGVPSEILKLSYDEVKDFHEKYYHPSNCTAYLYGDIRNIDAFLKQLDGYFSAYDRKETKESVKYKKASEGFVEKKYDFPAREGSGTDGRTAMVYAIDLGDPSDEELYDLNAFVSYCNLDSSAPLLRLRSLYPAAKFSFTIQSDPGLSVLYLRADNMNENDGNLLKESVQKIFASLAREGLATKDLENFKRRMESDSALAREGRTAAISMLVNTAEYSAADRGELFYSKMCDNLADMDRFDNDLIKKIAGDFLADPARSAMSVVVPRPGLAEKNDEKLQSMLLRKKSSMSQDDIKKLVEDTKRIEEGATDDPSEYLAKLNVVKVSDLSDTARRFATSDRTDPAGTRRIGVYTKNHDINVTKLYLDASGLPKEDLCYLSFFADLVNGHFIPAGGVLRNDLPAKISECMVRGADISLTVSSYGNDYRPYVCASFMSTPDKTGDAFDLMYKRLFESEFTDPGKVKEGIKAVKSTIGNNVANHPELLLQYLTCAGDAKGAAYYEYTHYIEYYDWLTKLEKKISEDPDAVLSKLTETGEYLRNKNNMILGYAVSRGDEKAYMKVADAFIEKLYDRDNSEVVYAFTKYRYPLALVTDRQMVYNGTGLPDISECGIKKDNKKTDLALSIISDSYVKAIARDRYGAYGNSYRAEYPTAMIFTANDPNSKETMKMFSDLPKAWDKITDGMSREELDGYIITMHSTLSKSTGEIGDATELIDSMASGKSASYVSDGLRELKNMKIPDLASCDGMFASLGSEGGTVTIGSESIINGNSEYYAQIIRPFR
ncbi:MAG: insulinase family protein [Lachnospiraceae bacterium]|nr:insulinase family protein [Lachnospiraceae bacterium]